MCVAPRARCRSVPSRVLGDNLAASATRSQIICRFICGSGDAAVAPHGNRRSNPASIRWLSKHMTQLGWCFGCTVGAILKCVTKSSATWQETTRSQERRCNVLPILPPHARARRRHRVDGCRVRGGMQAPRARRQLFRRASVAGLASSAEPRSRVWRGCQPTTNVSAFVTKKSST
mgnify:CR=1 FL=1